MHASRNLRQNPFTITYDQYTRQATILEWIKYYAESRTEWQSA